jgi:putative aldouronate transport system permease protein
MAAYVMFRKDVRYRNVLAFFLFFTTLFNGGLLPYYLLVARYLRWSDTIWPLLFCSMFSVVYILILRNFLSGSIPDSLVEAARIDGTGDFKIYWKIILPLFKPGLASIGFFIALGYWNDWWTAMMFTNEARLRPLQYVLYRILQSSVFAANMVNSIPRISMPQESLKLALTVIAIAPIMFLYPFVQRYFVSGIMIGSVKG